MSKPYDQNELRRLLAAWCNDTIDDAGVERLERLLAADPEARRVYLEYSSAEAEMYAMHAGPPSIADPAEPAERELGHDAWLNEALTGAAAGAGTAVAAAPSTNARPLVNALVIAASLAAVAVGSSWLTLRYSERQTAPAPVAIKMVPPTEDDAVPAVGGFTGRVREGAVVAKVSGTRNCRWAEGTKSGLGYGAELCVGERLELLAGIAELTFTDGVRAVVEGPAELLLPAEGDSVLVSGRLAAVIPPGAASPGIRTARMGVSLASLDRTSGAPEFGLSADGQQGDEVHVFRGDLQAFLLGNAGASSRSVRLTKHEAARVRPASTTVAKFFADRDKFVRSISSSGGPHDGLYAYEGFDYPLGPLGQQNGGFGWAGPWADIEAACPPGQVATNVVDAKGLQFPGLRSVGGKSAQVAQQNRVRRALSTSLGGVFDAAGLVENQDGLRLVGANGSTVYLSFLQRVDIVDDSFYGFELHRGDGNWNRVLCIGSGADGAGYGVTSNYNGYGASNYSRLDDETDAPVLFVVRIDFGAEHRDLVTVYRNPESLLDERGVESVTRLRGNFAFDRISFGNFDGVKRHEIDEVRVGTSYRAVTGRRDRGADWLTPDVAATKISTEPLAKFRRLIHNAEIDALPGNGKSGRSALALIASANPLFTTTH